MDNEYNEYGENPFDDMMADYDYHVNTDDLPELFDETSVDDFIANLNDWDWIFVFFWRASIRNSDLYARVFRISITNYRHL